MDEFEAWLEQIKTGGRTTLINSHGLVAWNLDKHYLQELQAHCVDVVETHFIEPGSNAKTLKEIHQELGWSHTVLKPCISASAKDTYQIKNGDPPSKVEERYQQLLASGKSMMLQPFQQSVVDRGEASLVIIQGTFTHAVLKVVRPGDFRVQDDLGAPYRSTNPPRTRFNWPSEPFKPAKK